MDYQVKSDALDSLYDNVWKQSTSWQSKLEQLQTHWNGLAETDNMRGAAADSIQEYIKTVHITMLTLLQQLISVHLENCLLYRKDYQLNIDEGLHFSISSAKLREHEAALNDTKQRAASVEDGLHFELSGIRDIFQVSYSDISDVLSAHSSAITYLRELDEDIVSLETKHKNDDFIHTGELIDSLRAFMLEQKGKTINDHMNFSMQDLVGSAAFAKLYQSSVAINQEHESKKVAIEQALEADEQYYAALKEEREEREKKATAAKWIVTGVCVIGSVAAIAATGGAATPLVMGAVSGVSGAIMAGTNNLANQYVEHGSMVDQYDMGSLFKDVVVGGVSGFVTGYVGGKVGEWVTKGISGTAIGKQVLQSTNGMVRIGSNAAIGAASEVTSGVAARGVGTLVTTGDVGKTFENAFSPQEMGKDFVIGGVGGGMKEVARTKQIQDAADKAAFDYNKTHNPLADGQKAGIKNLKTTKNLGVDFEDSDAILRMETGEPVKIKVKATGDRRKDYLQAEKLFNEQHGTNYDFKSMRTGDSKTHVWHHLDDYNAMTNETTLEFVEIHAHKAIHNHTGSAKQYFQAHGRGYGHDAYDPSYTGVDMTPTMSTISGQFGDGIDNVADTPIRRNYFRDIPAFNGLDLSDFTSLGAQQEAVANV